MYQKCKKTKRECMWLFIVLAVLFIISVKHEVKAYESDTNPYSGIFYKEEGSVCLSIALYTDEDGLAIGVVYETEVPYRDDSFLGFSCQILDTVGELIPSGSCNEYYVDTCYGPVDLVFHGGSIEVSGYDSYFDGEYTQISNCGPNMRSSDIWINIPEENIQTSNCEPSKEEDVFTINLHGGDKTYVLIPDGTGKCDNGYTQRNQSGCRNTVACLYNGRVHVSDEGLNIRTNPGVNNPTINPASNPFGVPNGGYVSVHEEVNMPDGSIWGYITFIDQYGNPTNGYVSIRGGDGKVYVERI